MTDVWTKWEGSVINGVFPLRRYLSRSNHSVVFLTEHRAKNLPDAAIKLVPADPLRGEAQLACWRMDAALSHPHLIRLFDVGRCQLGGHNFIFVVMEFADQTLAQLLAHRALTADEVREMLPPALDALAFLHRKRLVQGQLKPPNILVVNDQLKLASDTIRPAGASAASVAKSSPYDPPEAKDGRLFGAGDVWALGITLVEALTQRDAAWPDENSDTVALPATLPPAFADTVRRCLSRNPANRPTITNLEAQFKQTPAEPVAPAPEPVVQPQPAVQPQPVVPPQPVVQPRSVVQPQPVVQPAPRKHAATARIPVAIAAGGLIVLSLVWAGFRLHNPTVPERPAPATSATPAPHVALPAPVAAPQNTPASVPAPPAVLHQEIPEVSRSARESIHGRISVTIRVVVDRSGNVIHESVESPGSSRYFTRLGLHASKKWKFAPANAQEPRVWLLRFEFTRSGTTGYAAPRS